MTQTCKPLQKHKKINIPKRQVLMSEQPPKSLINNINLTTVTPEVQKSIQPTETNAVIHFPANPIALNVNTGTDWPTVLIALIVGVGGIFINKQLAAITKQNQQDAMLATRANFRQQWQQEIRTASAKYISLCYKLHHKALKNGQPLTPITHGNEYSALIELQSTIELMLDKKKPYSDVIIQKMEDIIDDLFYGKTSFEKNVNYFLDKMRDVLEKTWNDINKDINKDTNKDIAKH